MLSKKIFVTLSIVFIFITAFITNCADDDDASTPTPVMLGHITELSSIEIYLMWDEKYGKRHILDALINHAYAVVAPEYQLHYHHHLIFNHHEMTITDVYKSFVGLESSNMAISQVTRDRSVYRKFQAYLEHTPYLCTVTRPPIEGPARAQIHFRKTDGTK